MPLFIEQIQINQLTRSNVDKLAKSQKVPLLVIPAKAGIQENQELLDSRFRGSDTILTFYEFVKVIPIK
ncbi:MAG TPA: hypothetical protein DDW42_10415 [Desulfobacteraceae bacterium]|nr:hypothetical protein [Desulfobacteraceae bacterium]